MEISQQQFEELLEQIRELTARVYRLEELAGAGESKKKPEQPRTPAVSEAAARQPPPSLPAQVSTPTALPTRVSTSVPSSRPARTPSGDLESRIGSHWLNRIGITAVLVGASFFLNYAFENNWIGPAGRVVIGLIAGMVVVWWSEYFRKRKYDIFSYSLKALGVGVLYLSLWASFQVYHLLPSSIVFTGMVLVTASMCAMAFAQDAEILAVFAIAGGFSTPVLLSTGENREIALFSYLVLLDLAVLALTIVKSWRHISVLGFIGTVMLYIAWYNEFYDQTQLAPTLIFASLFFAIFAATPLFILRRRAGRGIPLGLALATGVTYFLQVYVMLRNVSTTQLAWFSLVLAAVYLLLVRIRTGTPDTAAEDSLRLLHLALAVGLITVAIPIRLEAHSITIGWLVESAALLWVGDRIKSDVLNWFAILALGLGIFHLVFWDTFEIERIFLNPRMATYGIAIAALGFAAYQCAKRKDEMWRRVAAVSIITLNVLALRALSLEVADYYSWQMPLNARNIWRPEAILRRRGLLIARDFTYSALWMAYGAMLMVIGFWRSSAFVRWQALALIALTTVKVFAYDTSQLDRIYRILSFVVLGVVLLGISFAYQRRWIKLPSGNVQASPHPG